jgi:hypothetical protein
MNKGIIFALGTVVGAAAGIAGTYFYLNKKMDKIIQSEIDEGISDYMNYISEKESLKECVSDENSEDSEESGNDRRGPVEAVSDSKGKKNKSINYNEIIDGLNYGKFDYTKPGKSVEETGEIEDAEGIKDVKDDKEYPAPYILEDGEDLWNENNSYAKIELIYYSKDQVITDYADREVEGAHDLIGRNNIDVLDSCEDEKDAIIYVMNESMATIYEVSLIRKSYTDDVLPNLEPDIM